MQVINQIQSFYANRGSLGTQQDVNQYRQGIASYNPEVYAAEENLIMTRLKKSLSILNIPALLRYSKSDSTF